ncbi:DUF2917 domain-containing protein [Anaeromyxobacter paludicola]|uniref:Uncharacterized protein n=1 Tax=Anaeromyxobacter paludicola TaxID=2918171 RepID=A0ABM7XF83_9BACT|nr:DUF2917 domain-containing protein [Anaeromyxobacter paludicola]BDG10559.1 hypothetical protein AMPC_36720 [Anaeromyxobacter paludicola]
MSTGTWTDVELETRGREARPGSLARVLGWARAGGRAAQRAEVRRELRRDATWRLQPGAGARVRCESGELLVTQAGDPRDHVLQAGQEVRLRSRGLVVAWALADSVLIAGA